MIKEAIDRILSLATVQQLSYTGVDGTARPYTSDQLYPVKEPMLDIHDVSTLNGFIDMVVGGVNGYTKDECFVQVEGHHAVSLNQWNCNRWGDRQSHVRCELPALGHFECGRWHDQEGFIIALQAFFEHTEDREYVLKTVSTIIGESLRTSQDDGISQVATTKFGIVTKGEETVKRLVTLKPYRTFREIDQPTSQFVFRIRSKPNELPTCALFEADGGVWKLEAVKRIKAYLVAAKIGMPVIA